jgi:hypothetical protein
VGRKQAAGGPAAASSGGNDLDDLLGDVLTAGTEERAPGSSHLVDDFQCTACDFQILCIEGLIWRGDVDYMFFRNSYPNVSKLRNGLQMRKGCRAFCCQCSWRSGENTAELADIAEGLRWSILDAT